MIVSEEDYLAHYGTLRKSGRYPWGSGDTQSARNRSFLDTVEGLRRQGLTDAQIAEGFSTKEYPFTTTKLRALKSIALAEQKQDQIRMAQRLKDKGLSNVAIGERMGINESSVRSLLAPGQKEKTDVLAATSSMLKDQVAKKGYIDIGSGVENHLGLTGTKLSTSVAMLQEEGYKIYYMKVPQLGTGKNTSLKVLAAPGAPYPKRDQVKQITEFTEDGGKSFFGLHPPLSISSKRVGVRYAEDGGADADGVIYVRPGIKDLDLGSSRYAQVRIAVDGSHYLKGMAMYKDDLPAGTDLLFNTNKSDTGNKKDAMKELKDDPDNPFGAMISRQHGAMNIVNEEGAWEGWSKSLSSQMLSKQNPELAKTQLAMTFERKKLDLDEISKLTNPTVRKKLLESFADDADSSAVHLKAAALPRQGSHVILPVTSMKDTEIYAPNYRTGERVVLVRYPHGGTFEIPELTVNNNHPESKKLLGQARDAVGIHPKVAERLSGADFDGDTVLVIPNNRQEITHTPALEKLKGFDPQSYKIPEDSPTPKITAARKQQEMGNVTNLIADMTIRGAGSDELARAVRHSMVVIDSQKHGLDYQASARDHGISALKQKYQESAAKGASTLITRATSQVRVDDRKPRSAKDGGPVDRATGKKVYEKTGATYVNRNGDTVPVRLISKKLAETDDAFTLSSGTRIETVYAEHSNRLKALANAARKDAVETKPPLQNKSARQVYDSEVTSLKAKLNIAVRNRPLERAAQVMANTVVAAKRQANPDMEAADLKKIKAQALAEARRRTGAKKQRIDITQEEWNAIQAGAISNHMLSEILNNSDLDRVRELATPRTNTVMTSVKQNRAKAMLSAGYTQSEVADALGVNINTLKSSISEGGE